MDRLLTVGELAKRFGVDIHRVEYAIKSRRIACMGRAGNSRVFSEEAAGRIGEALGEADANREALKEGGPRRFRRVD